MKKHIVFLVVSFLIIGTPAQAREVSRINFVEDMNILFLKGNYASIVKSAENDLSRLRLGTKDKKAVLYLAALSHINLKEFTKGREVLNDILKMKGNELREDPYIAIADSYFREKNFNRAIQVYEDVVRMYPRNDRISSVYYNLGLSYRAKKNPDKANFYFEKVKRTYEKSFEADKITHLSISGESPDYYIVQLGAFKSLRNAKKLVRRLARKKYDSYIQKVRIGGDVLYRVRGGKFSNAHYATRLERRLRRDGFQVKIIEE